MDESFRRRVEERADATAADLRRGGLGTVEPGPMSLFDHVYAHPHPVIDREREWFQAYSASFETEDQA